MSDFAKWAGIHDAIGGDLAQLRGTLRCSTCGQLQALGDVGHRLRAGWPTHCGYTMTWWTQRQIDAGEMPE